MSVDIFPQYLTLSWVLIMEGSAGAWAFVLQIRLSHFLGSPSEDQGDFWNGSTMAVLKC